jgi:hypothetical protein
MSRDPILEKQIVEVHKRLHAALTATQAFYKLHNIDVNSLLGGPTRFSKNASSYPFEIVEIIKDLPSSQHFVYK